MKTSNEFSFKVARRSAAKMKLALIGASGSGKTYSALRLAKGLVGRWEKIGIIDTENNSATLYAHLGPFLHLNLRAPFSPERYVKAIEAAEEAGIEALIIDSVSHEWDGEGGCLDINERIAREKFGGNTWSAWAYTGALHAKFIQKFLQADMHVVACARAKTETAIDGKKVIRVGTKEIQREGFEYEFATVFCLDKDTHEARATKDRTGLFPSSVSFLITEKTGQEIKAWAEEEQSSDEIDISDQNALKALAEDATRFFGDDPRLYIPKSLEVANVSKSAANALIARAAKEVSLAIVDKLQAAFKDETDQETFRKMKTVFEASSDPQIYKRAKKMLDHYLVKLQSQSQSTQAAQSAQAAQSTQPQSEPKSEPEAQP